ncbi:hypothetical protein ACTI_63020 [Actinoplanes sp. OR16]|nr:hypothetical protein ACTI_63020 [Actinoplanes sp. OR16]
MWQSGPVPGSPGRFRFRFRVGSGREVDRAGAAVCGRSPSAQLARGGPPRRGRLGDDLAGAVGSRTGGSGRTGDRRTGFTAVGFTAVRLMVSTVCGSLVRGG